MELDLIEYLESKDFEVEEIQKFQKKFLNKESQIIIKKFESIYKIFGYANLDSLTINSLIVNNPGLLTKPDSEIISIAYTWLNTGLLPDAAKRKRGIFNDSNERVYLRNLYLNANIKFNKSPISYNALVMHDSEFMNDYKGVLNDRTFYPTYENLVSIYGQGITLEEKQNYISSVISSISLKWFFDALRQEKEKRSENKFV